MYQVLARKYRPRNFNQLVGQTHVSRALTSALERNRLHHAYLFTGTRGVGKTTIARILSKCLNCETGITATPCEICATCVAINQGRFIDLIEIDAASRTKVEDTRELLDNVPYAPTQGRYKVYLIDEVHMLSTHSFNALLKTLEEPPQHVKFLLATTDPQKLPVTVLSRCLQFTLRPLQQQEIHDHLHNILDQEQIGYDDQALWQLAEAAQGSLRDALSLTDQAIAFGQGQLQGSEVQDMLGLLDKGQIVHLLQSIHHNNGQQVSQVLQNLANQAVDLKAVLDQLITLLHQLALLQVLAQVPLQGTEEYQQQLRQLAQQIEPTDIQLYYQIALQGRQDLKLAVSLQQGFDMCILRMLAFKPLQPNSRVLEPCSDGTVMAQQTPQHSSHLLTEHAQPGPGLQHSNRRPGDELKPVRQTSLQALLPTDELNLDNAAENQPANQAAPICNEHLALASSDLALQAAQGTAQSHEPDLFDIPVTAMPARQTAAPLTQALPDPDLVPENPENSLQQPAARPALAAAHATVAGLLPEIPGATNQPANAGDIAAGPLLPQQILQHRAVELTGTWNIEKWECWLREAEISPAIRNLAQHGLIRGEIGQTATFVISPEHRLMATELFDGLSQALTQQWADSRLELLFEHIDAPLPLQLKAIRREKALQQASQLLQQEAAIQPLMTQFAARLTQVSLKE